MNVELELDTLSRYNDINDALMSPNGAITKLIEAGKYYGKLENDEFTPGAMTIAMVDSNNYGLIDRVKSAIITHEIKERPQGAKLRLFWAVMTQYTEYVHYGQIWPLQDAQTALLDSLGFFKLHKCKNIEQVFTLWKSRKGNYPEANDDDEFYKNSKLAVWFCKFLGIDKTGGLESIFYQTF